MTSIRRLPVLALATLVLAACSTGPAKVHWGEDSCDHCRMVISDERFAAQVVDERGRAWKFDAVECMTAFVAEREDGLSAWVADGPDGWVPAREAWFVRSTAIRSPMAGGLMAFADEAEARATAGESGGELLRWAELLADPPAHESTHGHGGH